MTLLQKKAQNSCNKSMHILYMSKSPGFFYQDLVKELQNTQGR